MIAPQAPAKEDCEAIIARLVTAKSWPDQAWLFLAMLVAAITVTYRIGALPLIIPDEGRNAEVAREMKESGSWLVPTYNGLPYLDKPAFYFKAVALSLAAFGDNEFAARLPSALFGLGLLALLWWVARRECGPRPAALAVMVVATLPLFISQARIVIFDIALGFFVCLSIVAGYLAETTGGSLRRRWYLLGAAAAGFATLVKGPVGFLIPLVVLAVFNATERRWDALRRLLHPLNFLVLFAVVLPWFIGLSLAHPDFPAYGLLEESLKRFTTRQFRRTAPVYYYLLILPATFFPWSLLLPGAGIAALKQWRSLPLVSRFCIVWSLTVVTFFSLSQSKLPAYILSVTLPFGILVAQLADHALSHPEGRAGRLLRGATLLLAVITAVMALGLIIVAPQSGILSRPITIPKVDLNRFIPFFLPILALLVIASAANAVSALRRSAAGSVLSLALLPVLLVFLGSGVIREIFESRSARLMASQLRHLDPGTELVFLRSFPTGLPFYLRKTGTLITEDGGELTSNYLIYALKKQATWPSPVVPVSQFDSWMASRQQPVYLFFREDERPRIQKLASERGATIEQLPRKFLGVLLPPPRDL